MSVFHSDLFRQQALIAGSWRDAADGTTLAVSNPSTGATLGQIPNMGRAEAQQAVDAAAAALPAWRALTAAQRAALLKNWHRLILENKTALAQIMTQESELQAEQKELDNMSDIAAPADIERLREYASWLNYEMQIFDMRKYVITLEHTYYISGYVPESDVERLKQGLLMVHGVKACEDDEADAVDGAPDRQPPVKLKNNWFARPFEMFITMYGLPGYGDLDPTGFVAVTYALLFGIMFGDVGQGVLLGLIAYFVMWKKMHMELGRVVARCSVFSVIFGFLYGSVFGYEHVLDPMFHALGFAEKPLEVLAPEGINNILIASVVAGVLMAAIFRPGDKR